MAWTLAVVNQKGGVGKTTTAVNLATSLALAGRRVLLIDCDPQGNATSGLGQKETVEQSIYDALTGGVPLADVILKDVGVPGLDLAPATLDLAGAEMEMFQELSRETILKKDPEAGREELPVYLH